MATSEEYREFICEGLRLGVFSPYYPNFESNSPNYVRVKFADDPKITITFRANTSFKGIRAHIEGLYNTNTNLDVSDCLNNLSKEAQEYILFNIDLFIGD